MFDLIKKSLTLTEKTFDTSLFLYETGNNRHDGQGDFFGYLTDFLACMQTFPFFLENTFLTFSFFGSLRFFLCFS